MRPDELAKQSQIDLEDRFQGNIRKGIGTAASLGTAAISGAGAARVMPFLNQYIPADLAMKGINKVMPRLGAFLQRGKEAGLDVEEGLSYLKDRLGGSESEPAKQSKNIIEQESPELHTFLDQEIRKGRKPIEAAALAQNDKRFGPIIEKLTKAHKTPWSQIIEGIFGKGDMAQPGQQEQGQPNQAGPSGGKWDQMKGMLQDILNS